MLREILTVLVIYLTATQSLVKLNGVLGSSAPGDTVVIGGGGGNRYTQTSHGQQQLQQQQHQPQHQQQHQHQPQHQQQHQHHHQHQNPSAGGASPSPASSPSSSSFSGSGSHLDHRNSYTMLSEAMSQAVSNEFNSLGSGSADGSCQADDLECYSVQDRLSMEAIKSLHRQLDDDDNGNIDLSESDDFLREELKYDSGYEKRQKAFHYNDDMHISVKELWEAWLRSEVHNWTIEQTTDWLAQSVQLPQYVELFKQHKVTGAALPRLAVNNMHYVSNVLGIKDPIHKQKIALKAMDVVLFGPPRETGTRWKDYILVTLLLSAIIGCWYAYQQNKNAKRHLRRMAQDMEGLQKAEQALQEMQKELERARMEQENVATEKLDLERRLKEAPSLSSSSSDIELQQLKQEIEMLRSELSRAEVELVDHCWSPPPQLQSWLQYTYELESKNHLKKRILAEKQLQQAREACEKLRRKRSSLVGAFVSTHGKSIDDVDRSIVEARNSLSEVTNELQERLHRWKQIEMLIGFTIVNNNGLAYLENILYNRNGSGKSSRGRITNSTDDLDDESVQGMIDNFGRSSAISGGGRDDSSTSDDGCGDNQSTVQFYLGNSGATMNQQQQQQQQLQQQNAILYPTSGSLTNVNNSHCSTCTALALTTQTMGIGFGGGGGGPTSSINQSSQQQQQSQGSTSYSVLTNSTDSGFSSHNLNEDLSNRQSPSVSSSERSGITVPPPRTKKPGLSSVPLPQTPTGQIGRAPLPPPRRTNSHQSHITKSSTNDMVPMEYVSMYLTSQQQQHPQQQQQYQQPQQQFFQPPTALIGPTTFSIIPYTKSPFIGTTGISAGVATGTPPNTGSTNGGSHGEWNVQSATLSSSLQASSVSNGNGNSANVPTNSATSGNGSNLSASLLLSSSPLSLRGSTTSPSHQSTSTTSSTHSDPQIEDTNSTDSSSFDDEFKKRKRKLRFPFGKKSNKHKLA